MTLKTYLTERYTNIGNQLGWSSSDFDLIVSDTLEVLDITSEAETSAIKLHAVSVYLLWKKALETVSLDFDFSADGSSYKRSDLHAQVLKNLAMAESDAMVYLPNYQIEIGTLTNTEDPYIYSESRDEAGNY